MKTCNEGVIWLMQKNQMALHYFVTFYLPFYVQQFISFTFKYKYF